MNQEPPETRAAESKPSPADAFRPNAGKKVKKAASEKKELLVRLEDAEKQILGLQDRLLRTLAEMDNVRKRYERERAHIVQNASQELIRDLLPAVDDFERFLNSPMKKTSAGALREGIVLVYQKLMKAFHQHGLEPMEAKGKVFDVDFHDAVVRLRKEDVESGVVVEELQKGYLLNGKVVRHAKVAVSE